MPPPSPIGYSYSIVTAVWQSDGPGWQLLSSAGFQDEKTLHTLVQQAPHLLPLSGSPQIIVLGSEVQLGSGWADLVAVEPSGRLVLIEVKLAQNQEARRAVVSQLLAYAAALRGIEPDVLERDVLGSHLRRIGHESIESAVAASDQRGSFDISAFRDGLNESLRDGKFRLVFVLDEAPTELVNLVGYLESIGDKLVIDLVTVSQYEVSSPRILVPQRVDPERQESQLARARSAPASAGQLSEGPGAFEASIQSASEEHREGLRRLLEWALQLEREGLVKLSTYTSKSGMLTLLPRLKDEGVGLVTIYNDRGPYLQVFRSVFERRAPESLGKVEQLLTPVPLGQGNVVRDISDSLLEALLDAYREAVRRR